MDTGFLIVSIICVTIAAVSIVPMVQDYKLKKEKIKAEIMIKTEEIKAKNQLEMEKLLLANNPTVQPAQKAQAGNADAETQAWSHIKEIL